MTFPASVRWFSVTTILIEGLLMGCASTGPGTSPPTRPSDTTSIGGMATPHPAIGSPTTHATPTCPGQASAFMATPVPGLPGQPTPLAAARHFVRHGGVSGYGTPATRWHLGARTGSSGASIIGGSVTLHAFRLPDKTWFIDSGQRCS